ncbi:hypothetical protein BH10BAC3_BH10BAC3_15420 [soil metagenome]
MTIKELLTSFLLLFFIQHASGQLAADFSADIASGCAPIRVVFSDLSSGSPDDWKWDLGNGTIAEHTANPSTTYLFPGVFTVKLVAYNGTDSSVLVKTNYITVYAKPIIFFSGNPQSGCLPVNVQFKDSSILGTTGIANYQWDFGDGNIGSGKNPQHTYNIPGKFQVTLTIKNAFGCMASDSRLNYISAYDSIRARFGIKSPAACAVPATYKFTDSSTGAGIIKRTWDFGDGTTSNLTNPSHVYVSQGSYKVSLIIQNINGCADTLEIPNAITPGNYTANFSTPAGACVGKPVSFTNTSIPGNLIDSSRWSFGDGKNSIALNPSHTYVSNGNYTVKLVTWFGTCADSILLPITISPQPVAKFTASPTGTCKPPLVVTFNNMTIGGTVVKWSFGNGTTSTVTNPVFTYNSYGSYDVTLIVKNASGCFDTLIKKDYIVIDKPVISSINNLPFIGCMPWSNVFSLNVNSPEPVVKYEWDFGDGTTSNLKNPSHDFTDTTEYKISAVITTASGCSDTIRSFVHGGQRPTAAFKGAPNIVCPLDPVVFTNLSSSIANSWFWEFGDGGTSEDQSPAYLYKDTGFMNVTLVAFNNGCADTIVIPNYVYVYPPIARFIDSAVCSDPYTVYLTDNSKGGTYWKWYLANSDSVEAKNTVYTFRDTGLYTVRLYIKDSLCENNAMHEIRIIDEKAAFAMIDSGVCGVIYKRFNAAGPQTHPEYITKYHWDFGDGSSLDTDTSSALHLYKKNGSVTVTLIITDIHGCTDTTSESVNIQIYGPKADFSPLVSKICAGSILALTDASVFSPSNPLVKWTFDFGNGFDTPFTSAPFTAVYDSAGVYDVKLTVEDSAGCSDVVTKKRAVVVYKPVASFISSDTIICINTPAVFTNQSTGALLKSSWDFGNGNTSLASNPSSIYNALGKYDVKLIVSDSLKCTDTIIKPKYISIEQTYADFSISDSFTTCPPLVVIFNNKSVNNNSNKWDFGNGNSSSLESPSHTYTAPGTFIAKLVVTGNGGCTDSATKKITIQGPYGTFSYSPLAGCPPLKAEFVSNAVNTKSITWDFSDGESDVSTDSTVSHYYKIPGTYIPKVIFSDGLGCKLPVQGLDTIRVIGAKAYIRSVPVYDYCDSATISFFDSTITTDIIKSYKWNFGDGTLSSVKNPVHTYLTPGHYNVTFEVQTVVGCISRDTLPEFVTIAKTPKAVIGQDTAVCVPAGIQFKAVWVNKDTSQIKWQWTFGNGETSGLFQPPVISYNTPGAFPVQLIGTNFYGCADTAIKILNVNDTPVVVARPASTICIGSSITLFASGGVSYLWDNNSSLSCFNCQNPVAAPLNEQTYKVTATDNNGCRASGAVIIKVQKPLVLKVGPGDTLCVGQSLTLNAAGTDRYLWSPPDGLSSTNSTNPTANPVQTTNYMVVGSDSLGCFNDTGYTPIKVYPIPQFNIVEDKITGLTGSIATIATTSSADITRWHWTPPTGLSCSNCQQPTVTIGTSITYTATASNPGLCKTSDRVTIVPVCNQDNVYIPNTFSPNGDGQNDIFYPRGKGVSLIKSMRIFSRWGELLFEQKDFALNDPGAGWKGTYKGALLTPDVYVYMIDVLCDNNILFNMKGNLTLLK